MPIEIVENLISVPLNYDPGIEREKIDEKEI